MVEFSLVWLEEGESVFDDFINIAHKSDDCKSEDNESHLFG